MSPPPPVPPPPGSHPRSTPMIRPRGGPPSPPLLPLVKVGAIGGWAIGACLYSPPTLAQIVPDGSLSTRVTVEEGRSRITEGDRVGNNLFHSFREFSIPSGGEAFFDQAAEIQTIFSRVTGGQRSDIDGLIRANGSASLFLLNPAGILFGPNATLNLGGSFFASTAEGVVFADGTEFRAIETPSEPLLTVSAPIGLQFGANSASIVHQSRALDSQGRVLGLQVPAGRTLGFLGGDVSLDGGIITTPGGRVEIGSVTEPGRVNFTPVGEGWALNYDGVEALGNLELVRSARINTSGNPAGDIQLRGGMITLRDNSRIQAVTQTAQGGTITIAADRVLIQEGSQVFAATVGSGSGGNILVQAQEVNLLGSRVDEAGNLLASSGLFASVQRLPGSEPGSATGTGGNLTITTNRLFITQGAQAAVTTFDAGNAGNLTVQAQDIELVGVQNRPNLSPIPSGLFAGTDLNSTGAGGNLRITTHNLTIRGGAEAQVSTLGAGDAGSLTVLADRVALVGRTADGLLPSALLAVAGLEGVSVAAEGQGGDLTLVADRLTLEEGAEITVSAEVNSTGAGNLTIQAPVVELDTQSALRAETAAGDRGNITVTSADLRLRRGSQITTNATGSATGGNISLNTQTLVALENSDITANAQQSFGGRVIISAQGIFGTAFREQLSEFSDITATSDLGPQFSGVVEIQTPDVDPAQGLVELPSNVVDVERLIANTCAAESEKGRSEFTLTGRGGLPASPTQALGSEVGLVEWVERGEVTVRDQPSAGIHPPVPNGRRMRSQKTSQERGDAIAEVQGWQIDRTGQVVLLAEAQHPGGTAWGIQLPSCSQSGLRFHASE